MRFERSGFGVAKALFLVLLSITIMSPIESSAAAPANDRPIVTLTQGRAAGVREGDVEVFRGLPFAGPPVGPLRWRAPQTAADWQDVRDASQFGPICVQHHLSGPGPLSLPQSEDCLTLNVWRPQHASNLPVMVWIYGGANRSGSGAFFDGTPFAKRGVVYVGFNYRLGNFGFFAHPALTAEAGEREAATNFGLLDQIAALRWVKDNIAAFGGDPDRVTVFGESAGGAAVINLMSLPNARSLFSAAIVESGGGLDPTDSFKDREQYGVEVAKDLGLGEAATTAQLRAVPADRLLAVGVEANPKPGFGPVVDGRALPAPPVRTLRAGGLPVPLMIGVNSDEGVLLQSYELKPAEAITWLGGDDPDVKRVYGAMTADIPAYARRLYGDVKFAAPARALASLGRPGAEAWLYRFDYNPRAAGGSSPGAPHGGELWYVFNYFGAAWAPPATKENLAVAAGMGDCWAAFATHQDPARSQYCAGWRPYSAERDNWLVFDSTPAEREGLDRERLDAADVASRKLGIR